VLPEVEDLASLRTSLAQQRRNGTILTFALPSLCPSPQLEDLNALNVIHVTGTKGKGSTSAFIASLLSHAPLAAGAAAAAAARPKVGLYTSPHLVFVRERIRIDGRPVDEETFARYFWQVWDRLGANTEVSVCVWRGGGGEGGVGA
jgi:folylpolyglutamate synthase